MLPLKTAERLSKLGKSIYGYRESRLYWSALKASDNFWPNFTQLKLLPKIFNHTEKRIALAFLILCAVTSLTIIVRIRNQHTVVVPISGGEYTEALVGEVNTLNPLLATNQAEIDITRLTNRGLFKISFSGMVIPDLATSVQISSDKKTYQIKLKNNLIWSDSNKLTADDIVFTFEAIKNPEVRSPWLNVFKKVEIKKDSDDTVSFVLPEAYPNFLNTLTVGLIPQHIWTNTKPTDWINSSYNFKPISNGPFLVKSVLQDKTGVVQNVVLETNPNTPTSQALLNRVIFKIYIDKSSAIDAMKQNQVQAVSGLNHSDGLNNNGHTVATMDLPQYTALFFNLKNDSLIKQKNFRQALFNSLNKNELIKKFIDDNVRPSYSPFVIGDMKKISLDNAAKAEPNQVKDLMDDLGYTIKDEQKIYTNKDSQEATLTISVINDTDYLRLADYLKEQWEQSGFKINLDIVEPSNWSDIIKQRQFEAIIATETIGLDQDPYPYWHSSQISGQGLNLSAWQNFEADKLIVSARRENDTQKKNEYYLALIKILNQDKPAIFLFSKNYQYLIPKNLNGWQFNIISEPADRFNFIESWYLKTKRQ